MKIKNKLALFDYDGTIVDSAKMIVKGAIEAFRVCGIPDPDPKKVRENICFSRSNNKRWLVFSRKK